MIDEVYRNSFKEVHDILENTDDELLAKIPSKFMEFLNNNMNSDYMTNIDPNIDIDKQPLLKETEALLSLIYRSYWATADEKKEFAIKDADELKKKEEMKKQNYEGKDIYQVFEQRKNLDSITLDNSLMVIKKENFMQRILNKILNLFKK